MALRTPGLGLVGGRLACLLIASLIVAAAFSGPVGAHGGDDGLHHHDGWMGTHDGVFGGLGFLWMFLWAAILIGLPIALVYLLVARRGAEPGTDDDALAILRRRYADCEIDEEEFENRRATLRSDGR